MTDILFPLVGVISLLIGIFLIIRTKKLKKTGINTTATVKEIVTGTSGIDNGTSISTMEGGTEGYSTSLNFRKRTANMFYPVISFTTKDGKEIIKQSDSGSNPSAYKVGQQVKIFYTPENPEKFMIDNFINTKLLPYGTAIIGLIILVAHFI